MDYLDCLEIEPAEKADAAVIWLHGLGADGYDFAPIVRQLKLPQDLRVRFVFPHAPCIPVTVNQGQIMPAWYDLASMNFNAVITDRDDLVIAGKWISDLVNRERERGILSTRIVVAGFSQGGSVAYQVALTYAERLAGLMALSTYFASDVKILARQQGEHCLPIQIYHGTEDSVVPTVLGEKAFELLQAAGYAVDYRTYPMPHAVCDEQVGHIAGWIQKVLAG